jgi:hypothetical protein
MEKNNLADQAVVFEVLRTAVDELMQHYQDESSDRMPTPKFISELSGRVADVFLGKDRSYLPVPGWNEPGKIDEWIITQIPFQVATARERVQMAIIQFFSDLVELANFANQDGVLDEQWKPSWTEKFIEYCMLLMGVPELDVELAAAPTGTPESRLSPRQKQLLERWRNYP